MRFTFTHIPETKEVLITGDTYRVRHEIKALGGQWNARRKGWLLPQDQWEAAEQQLTYQDDIPDEEEFHASETRKYDDYVSHFTVTSSGHEMYRNKNGRCEDAPCCGCCNY